MSDFSDLSWPPSSPPPPPRPPDNAQLILIGLQCLAADRMREAEAAFRAVAARDTNPTARFLLALMLPHVYGSAEDMAAWRGRIETEVRRLAEEDVTLDLGRHLAVPLFLSAYHGVNDVELHRALTSRYVPPPDPPLAPRPPVGGRKIRVGFISTYFRDHTIGRLAQGVIAQLDRREFEVIVFGVRAKPNDVTADIAGHADRYLELAPDPASWRQSVREQNLDVLYYTDLGMEPLTYTLAFSRLAPVQCTTWGHPDTTAIPTIDYFISGEELDTPDAQRHYTEKLVRLPLPAVYYHRPQRPAAVKARADFGFADGDHLYGCPQTLYKFHPDFDAILAGVLRADPRGRLVLIRGQSPVMDDVLLTRFRRTMPDVIDRVHFVPRQDRAGYLSLCAAFDVMLDTIHFGGGNTSYEAFALGVPVVTLPSAFLRGRITYAQYRMMGIEDPIVATPEEYVAKAVQLGTDPDRRAAASEMILAANDVLFENAEAVRGLEDFFRRVVSA
jgi:predicted O-linked N-acetylglucosamine transferase (SPINDLY family)